MKNKENFKFSFLSLICPNIFKKKGYKEALDNIYEYTDIAKIIEKLQDVDKLKMILFDENQRVVFDQLPKPGIHENPIINSSNFTMKSIKLTKNIKNRKENASFYTFLLNGNPINTRMMALLDNSLKDKLKGLLGSNTLLEAEENNFTNNMGILTRKRNFFILFIFFV